MPGRPATCATAPVSSKHAWSIAAGGRPLRNCLACPAPPDFHPFHAIGLVLRQVSSCPEAVMADYYTHFSCLLDVGTPENAVRALELDRKSTRLNSSHVKISYAVF